MNEGNNAKVGKKGGGEWVLRYLKKAGLVKKESEGAWKEKVKGRLEKKAVQAEEIEKKKKKKKRKDRKKQRKKS